MYYLKFISKEGIEKGISCYSYTIQPRNGWVFVTTHTKEESGVFDTNFCVGEESDWCSMFIMNINGKTIDKHTPVK